MLQMLSVGPLQHGLLGKIQSDWEEAQSELENVCVCVGGVVLKVRRHKMKTCHYQQIVTFLLGD